MEAGAPAGPALHSVLGDLADPRERALATELVYGVTRVRGALDAALAEACHRPLRSLDPAVRAALRLGCYQLRVTDRIPAHAAVGSSVELVRRHGRPEAAGFVNAVLRHLGSTAPAEAGGTAAGLAARHGHPAWLVARWLSRLGPAQTERLLEANNARPAVSLRANVLRATGPALHAELLAAGLEARPGRFLPEAVRVRRAGDPGALDAVAGGRCTVQGEASMLVGAVADPRPGELCLDVAAAPGGKATHLAERMGDRGRVVANDRSPERAALCAQSAARLGLGSVETRSGDARALPAEFGGRCDVVLADLPCTGFGTLAARPDLRWRRRPEDIATLAALQADLLAAAGRCVKPGGLLVYSTCTTEPEENEAVVAGFLADHAAFEPVDLRERVPAALRDEPGLEAGMLRLWPHVHDTEGFFIAALARRGGRARAGGERPAEPRS